MILPAILTDEFQSAQETLDKYAQLSPLPPAVHFDIIDGFFADNLTIDIGSLRDLNRHALPLDLHLMVVEPADFLVELVGTEGVRTVIAQVERLSSQMEYTQLALESGWKVGFSLNLYTPLEAVDEEVWKTVSTIQVMGGEAGSQGQLFHPSALAIIRQAKKFREERSLNFRIAADIAMNPETIQYAHEAGADDFVIGSYLHEDMQQRWQELTKENL